MPRLPGIPPSPSSPQRTLTRSRAFLDASLQSEVRRAYAVIGVLLLVILLLLLPDSSRDLDPRILAVGGVGLAILLSIQLGVLWSVRWARARELPIPSWFIAATVVFESLIPSGILMWHILQGTFPPYAVLSSPPVLAYGLLITLTTLRLRPWLCILSSFVCGGSYAFMLWYVVYVQGHTTSTTGVPQAAYVNSAIMIFISGIAAAWVAREIRGHFQAALNETETRHQMARIERDLAAASSIQHALLPRVVPSIAGFDIAGWNRSADQTGGDYYDWQELPSGNWIVSLADVSGHGIGPAMVTAACRAYVRAGSFYHEDLSSLVSRINDLLAEDLQEGRFVTMVSVLVDPTGGPLRLLSAGHGPIALYIGATGEIRDILPQDLPLAIIPELSFGPGQSIQLAPGDVLALVTDGFVEWTRPQADGHREQFGMTRLRDSLRKNANLSAADMIQAIAAEVSAFAGSEPQQDDLTMVILKCVSAPTPAGTPS